MKPGTILKILLLSLVLMVAVPAPMPAKARTKAKAHAASNRRRHSRSRRHRARRGRRRRRKPSKDAIRRKRYARYRDRYMQLVRQARFGGRKAVYASWIGGGWVLRHNWKAWMKPASCAKIFTTATALREMGLDFRFTTQWFGSVSGGVMTTPLYWWSDGDPSITDDDVRAMVKQLKALGVREIPKGIVIDSHYFSRSIPPGFERYRGKEGYRARPSAVMVNMNSVAMALWEEGGSLKMECYPSSPLIECSQSVQPSKVNRYEIKARIRSGILKIHVSGKVRIAAGGRKKWIRIRALDPERLAAGVLIHELKSAGITVPPAWRRGHVDRNLPVLVLRYSAPLYELVSLTNKRSLNQYAENILRALGAYKFGPPGTTRKGLVPVRDLVARSGFSRKNYRLRNGSGLFGGNRVPPIVLVGFLKRLHTLPWLYKAVYDSLAVPGQDGTMYTRFKDYPKAARYLHAKTGTLGDTTCLSGYLSSGSKTLAFAIMNDGIRGRISLSRKFEDQVIRILVDILENETPF